MRYHRWPEPAGRVRSGTECLTGAVRIAHAYSDANIHLNSNGYCHSHLYAYFNGYIYSHSYGDIHLHTYRNSHGDSYCDSYGHADLHAYSHTDADLPRIGELQLYDHYRRISGRHHQPGHQLRRLLSPRPIPIPGQDL